SAARRRGAEHTARRHPLVLDATPLSALRRSRGDVRPRRRIRSADRRSAHVGHRRRGLPPRRVARVLSLARVRGGNAASARARYAAFVRPPLALLLGLAVTIAACAPAAENIPADVDVAVHMQDYRVLLSVATVKAGTVRFGVKHEGNMEHSCELI